MLRPQDTAFRETKNLDGLWNFRVDHEGVGRQQRWFAAPLTDARAMAVPGSVNGITTDGDVRDFVGEMYYQRVVRIPRGWTGQRITLYLESATHGGTVWVGETEVVAHRGGYLPFEADLTPHVTPGEEARITICVDTTLSYQTIPPGEVVTTATGRKKQLYWHDFYNFTGIHRSVWLAATPTTYVDDVTVITGFAGTTGSVRYDIAISGPAAAATDARLTLRDEEGRVVAEGRGVTGELSIADVTLWRPGAAYLYDLQVELLAGGRAVDEYRIKVGVRTVRIDGIRFLINDEPFYFTGFGMHEDHVTVGKQHNDALMLRDFELIEWIHANSFRTSHYPYSENVMDYADRVGIVVIAETPAVGLNLRIGGGPVTSPGKETFSAETVNDATREVHGQVIRDLIARDKNHPCVVIWSIANEPESDTEASERYLTPLLELARSADPSRPVGFVNVMLCPWGKDRVTRHADLVMINRYFGWYLQTGDLAAAEQVFVDELEGWSTENKPIIVTEYGADAFPGLHELPANPWSEEYEVEYLRMNHAVFDRFEAVVGEQMWNFADFATKGDIIRVGGNKKGAFTRDRQPKAAAHYLRERWAGKNE